MIATTADNIPGINSENYLKPFALNDEKDLVSNVTSMRTK